MTWASALDMLTKTVRDTFPTKVTYTPEDGSPESITAVFDLAAHVVEVDRDIGLNVDSTVPTLTVRLADLSVTPHVRDRVIIGSTTYEVYRVELDGSGMAALRLTEVS